MKKFIGNDATVNIKNTHAHVLENSRIWENPTKKNQNTWSHFLNQSGMLKNMQSLCS